jgi:hypothetical protein
MARSFPPEGGGSATWAFSSPIEAKGRGGDQVSLACPVVYIVVNIDHLAKV